MEGDVLQNILNNWIDNPLLLSIGIIIATFILEDAATVTAALFAADGIMPAEWAIGSLFIGIVAGDLGLYGLGMLATRFSWAQRLLEMDKIDSVRTWIGQRTMITVISARFIPGMRLPTYTASGFFRLSFVKFAFAAIIGTAIWTAFLFSLLYIYGQPILDSFGPWRWAAVPVLIIAVVMLPRLFALFRTEKVA